MTEELGPEARALLDAAREGLSPDAAAVRRVRARIAGASGGAAVGTAIGVKLGVLAVVAAVAAGAWVYARRDTTAAPIALRTRAPEPVQPPASVAVARASSDDDLITIEPAEGAPSSSAGPARVAPARPPARPATAREATPPVTAPARAVDLAREVALVDLAMAALGRGDATGALDAVRRHAAETGGRGQLAEDAAAIEIEALCRLHDPTTGGKLAAFDARFPRSAQRSRLTSQCP